MRLPQGYRFLWPLTALTDTLATQLTAAGLEVLSIDYLAKETVNHKEDIKMDRTFVQARCRRPMGDGTTMPSAASVPAAAAPTQT